jgi:hypothetical protein
MRAKPRRLKATARERFQPVHSPLALPVASSVAGAGYALAAIALPIFVLRRSSSKVVVEV